MSEIKTLNLKGLFNVSDIIRQRLRQSNKKHNHDWTNTQHPKGVGDVLSECIVMNLDMDMVFLDLSLETNRGANKPFSPLLGST